MTKVKLIEHNSDEQMNWSGYDDTRKFLKVGAIYEAKIEVHTWHTRIIIDGHRFNSVCFERLTKKI